MPSIEAGNSSETSRKSPPPPALSGRYKDSFAYPTLKDRVPIIICKVIDLLHRQRRQLERDDDPNALKSVIEKMAQLRYELQTNKPFSLITDGRDDELVWNSYLEQMTKEEGEHPKWFFTRWLYAECYAYRRLLECMSASPTLSHFDFFQSQKEDSFFGSLSAIRVLSKSLHDLVFNFNEHSRSDKVKHNFLAMLEVSLWGNKCDLSISAGSAQSFSSEPLEQVLHLRSKLLIDNSELVWNALSSANDNCNKVIDIVMDNAGFELFADLCLADFLVTFGLASNVRMRVKKFPWFVSDTTPADLEWFLEKFVDGAINPVSGDGKCDELRTDENDAILLKLGIRWKEYFASKKWTIHADAFWTYPHDYSLMRSVDPDLYNDLSQSRLIIFKGDLNYRKLVGDLKWRPTDTFEDALQGFHPNQLVALRTLKADVVTGLSEGQAERVGDQDPNWMVNGEWGLIQFCPRKKA